MYSNRQTRQNMSAVEFSNYLLKEILNQFAEVKITSPERKKDVFKPHPDPAQGNYNATRTEFSKKIYLETKYFLNAYQNDLNPTDKGIIFKKYLKLWKDVQGCLDIAFTDYAEQYQKARFGKYGIRYDEFKPMLAGFNLKNTAFKDIIKADLIFLNVDFTGSSFRGASFYYGHFSDCNFKQSTMAGSNFCHTVFHKCDLEGLDLTNCGLSEAKLNQCILFKTQYTAEYGLFVFECFKENLFTAISHQNVVEAIRLVNTFPALIHSYDRLHNTPLHEAVYWGQIDLIAVLLKKGASMHRKNFSDQTPFSVSLRRIPPYGSPYSIETFAQIVTLFIDAGLNLNTKEGKEYLRNMAFTGSLDAIKILKAHVADINLQDKRGNTVLHRLAYYRCYFNQRHEEIFKWFLDAGADKDIKNRGGLTALDYAKSSGNTRVINLLSAPPYPFFLQHLKVKPKKLTAEKVAYSLWLSDKDAKTTRASRSEFTLWASKQHLDFTDKDVEQCLKPYVMKS
ncbi:ankyrin repeat domain-containing protein [Legionella worsleiensis]|uniref:Ankyrin repeats (3 copies) n=1 Tax=Legionella worsleiensis TaxID=45076 RepID=A0A0W1AEF5_9GAMM|nr:ankyrin repeat domain-containing protein [Legionella worsleiensis]KTD79708.1 Ankyrin repeats (3 copies) [Legionella worsleiensis]STY32219.1 Ribulose-5-phosphate 4-epimerase and related epimerases and aldolases [Legionella worsleiensis]